MEHTPDDPRRDYKPITFYVEDFQKFFAIAKRHGGEPKAVFEKLQPLGGKWTVTDPADLSMLADKFRHAGDFNFFVAFPKVNEWGSKGVSIRTWLGLTLAGDIGIVYEAAFADLDRYLTLLEEKYAVSKTDHGGIYFVPSERPAPAPKLPITVSPEPEGFWERHRGDVIKTLLTEPIKIAVTFVIAFGLGALGLQQYQKVTAPSSQMPAPSSQPLKGSNP